MGLWSLKWIAVAGVMSVALSGCAGSAAPARGATTPPGEFPRPAAAGEVLAQATVLQNDGEAPKLCLGGVAESYPPLCSGPPIVGWDWASVDHAESASGVTWGDYAVTGTWDAAAFTVTRPPIPLSLYDGAAQVAPWDEADAGPSDEGSLLRLQEDLHAADYSPSTFSDWSEAPVLSDWAGNGYLWVSVIYDDGSVQRFFDDQFGAGLVAVRSALVPVG